MEPTAGHVAVKLNQYIKRDGTPLMNPAFVVALCGLAITVLLQTATVAYFIGRLTQRVSSLEEEGSGHSHLAIQFAAFEGKMEAEMRNLRREDGG